MADDYEDVFDTEEDAARCYLADQYDDDQGMPLWPLMPEEIPPPTALPPPEPIDPTDPDIPAYLYLNVPPPNCASPSGEASTGEEEEEDEEKEEDAEDDRQSEEEDAFRSYALVWNSNWTDIPCMIADELTGYWKHEWPVNANLEDFELQIEALKDLAALLQSITESVTDRISDIAHRLSVDGTE